MLTWYLLGVSDPLRLLTTWRLFHAAQLCILGKRVQASDRENDTIGLVRHD